MTPLTYTNSTTLKPIVHTPWTPSYCYKKSGCHDKAHANQY